METGGFFEGWYYKHQADGQSLAVIPGRARDGAFIQVVTDGRSYIVPYDLSGYRNRGGGVLRVGGSAFSPSGVTLDIRRPDLTLSGEIRYTGVTPVRSDVMGPFRFFQNKMECRHGVISMRHDLSGAVALNGETLDFTGGTGYIESDSGRSFPKEYTWLHCGGQNYSLMASVARVPFCGLNFWGCICVVWLDGREYRLATYNGVKIRRCERGALELSRGKYRLSVTVDTGDTGAALAAPRSGAMDRVIRERLACPARFRFTGNGRTLLDGGSDRASYEWAMESARTSLRYSRIPSSSSCR